nr:MAG TPA: hypothetical protein [Caudoviricetes sp.]
MSQSLDLFKVYRVACLLSSIIFIFFGVSEHCLSHTRYFIHLTLHKYNR